MSIPTTALSETSPAGGDQIALGDNVIRRYKTQNREILEVDHNYPNTGQDADAGKHKKVSLLEQADLGSGAEGKPILGAQTVSDKAELVFTDEDDNDVQITKAGVLKPSTSTVLADWSAVMNLVYPIGSVVTLGVSTNPATLFGVGTWTAIEGRVIVGKAASGTFGTLNATMGAETHTHPAATTGNRTLKAGGTWRLDDNSGGSDYDVVDPHNHSIPEIAATNHLQPTIVKFVWERTL
jgi:hypothetical protein